MTSMFTDTLRLMISNQRDSEGLKASFNSANVFERVVGFVSKFQVSKIIHYLAF